jgi:hypothetical protein
MQADGGMALVDHDCRPNISFRKVRVRAGRYDAAQARRANRKGNAMVSSRVCLILIVAGFWMSAALAQVAVGGPNKSKNTVGGPTSQVNPVVPPRPGATPTPKPKK